jgi:hypothetical protein
MDPRVVSRTLQLHAGQPLPLHRDRARGRLIAIRHGSTVGLLPVGSRWLACQRRAVHAAFHEHRTAQTPRVDRRGRQPVDPTLSIDGAPCVAAVHVRRCRCRRLLPRVGWKSKARLGVDAPNRRWRRPRPLWRPSELHGRRLSEEDDESVAGRQSSLRERASAPRFRTSERFRTTGTSWDSRSRYSTPSNTHSAGRRRSTIPTTRIACWIWAGPPRSLRTA